jgi:S1-C subfamily serine protease
MRRPLIAGVAALTVTGIAEAPAAVPGSVIGRVADSVVRVDARGCTDRQPHVGSGFVWPENGRVVTALHVVAGCRALSAYHEGRQIGRDARILRVLRRADLALLEVAGLPAPPVAVSSARPGVQQELAVLGIDFGTSISSKNLHVAFGSSVLRDITPINVQREINAAGVLELDLEVVRLDGPLLPGHSGGPIFDEAGTVLAIGDGGLKSGAVNIGWATPAAYLQRLIDSVEPLPSESVPIGGDLFAATQVSSNSRAVRCGGTELGLVEARSFDEIARTTDDPVGLSQLMTVFSQTGVNPSRLRFDIYVDPDSGGTAVLPSGTRLVSGDPFCRATAGGVQLFVRAAGVQGVWDAQGASLEFENSVIAATRLLYVPDPNWSYLAPHSRFDGLMLNRKSFVGYDSLTQVSRAFAFETLLTRGRSFFGVAAINYGLQPELVAAGIQACTYQPLHPACSNLRAAAAEWQPFVLGVFFSTFPIG